MYPYHRSLGIEMDLEKPCSDSARSRVTHDPLSLGAAAAARLLLEVADGVIVRVGDEVFDALLLYVLLEVVHQSGAVPANLSARAPQISSGFGARGPPSPASLACSLAVMAQNAISAKRCSKQGR